jgi:hypothetical protein
MVTRFTRIAQVTQPGQRARLTRAAFFFSRVFLLFFLFLLGLGGSEAWATPETARVHVRGIARIDAHVSPVGSAKIVVAGRVVDATASGAVSAAGPSGSAPGDAAPGTVSLRMTKGTGQSAVTLASAAPEACPGYASRPAVASAEQLVLPTDTAGRFCVQLSLPALRYDARLEVAASDRLDGASAEIPVDAAARTVTLSFDDAPAGSLALSLDGAAAAISVHARVTDASAQLVAARDLPLTLATEAAGALGEVVTDATGQAVFGVATSRLGPPGRGELRVSFAGDTTHAPASATASVERRVGVVVDLPDAARDKLPDAPIDDVAVRAVVTAACAPRGCQVVPTGTLEVRTSGESGSVVLGAAPLEHGAARVVLEFGPLAAASDATLTVRYVPDAPWFVPPADRAVAVTVRAQGPWARTLLVAAGVAVLLWLVIARLPLAPRAPAPGEGETTHGDREPAPRVDLVRAGDAGRWSGRVVDAHDGTAIGEARVSIERPAFRDVRVLAHGASDAEGAFALRCNEVIPGDELVVESRTHASVRRPVPQPGEIEVALVQRRRLLVDQLVAWAKRRGKPFDARPDPTPAHVRRAAGRLEFALEQRAQAARIEHWAEAVEVAAYGGAPVDARAQAEVEGLGPPDTTKPSDPPRPPR